MSYSSLAGKPPVRYVRIMQSTDVLPGQRGPVDHAMRERVIATAHARFRANGFGATSVAEIASDLDVAPTYLYKFFQSKTAIGEAVCGSILYAIDEALWRVARSNASPQEKMMQLFRVILKESVGMFFAERKLHDMIVYSLGQHWSSIDRHQAQMRAVIAHILAEGIESQAFDPALNRDEAVEALFWALYPFAHPRVLEERIEDDLDRRAAIMGRFCVRALSPQRTQAVTD